MLEVNYQTMTDNISVDYDDIIAQVKIAPREYLPDIYKYIAFILYFRHISYHQWSLSIKTVRNIPLNFLIFVKNIKIYIDKKT